MLACILGSMGRMLFTPSLPKTFGLLVGVFCDVAAWVLQWQSSALLTSGDPCIHHLPSGLSLKFMILA